MGTEQASFNAATTKNIEQALTEKKITRNALATKAGIPKSTLYRNLNHPDQFSLRELGQIAEALEVPFTDLFTEAA